MSSKTNFAEDIRFFREAVSSSITPLLQQLEKELSRISSLPPKCHEKVAIELFGKKHYKNPRFVDYFRADASQWLQIVNDFLKILAKDNSPLFYSQTESKLSRYLWLEKKRANELTDVIRSISDFLPKIQEGFVSEASFNYAQRKYRLTYGDDDIPSREEIVPFLRKIQQTDVILGDRIVSSISKMVGPLFRDYLLRSNYTEAEQCLPVNASKIRPILLEFAALQSGLSACPQVYSALRNSIEVCRRIDENYYINEFNANAALPVFPSASYDDVNGHLEQSIDQWSKEEYLAILGKEKQDYTFQYNEPENGEYFPGFKKDYWYADIVEGIASAVSSYECIDEEEKALFMYVFFGYGDAPKLGRRLYWKDQYDSRKKDGTVRHPSELYYLLDKLYCDRSIFTPDFISRFIDFSDRTDALVNNTLSGGKIQQMAQRCNHGFKETIDQIIDKQ